MGDDTTIALLTTAHLLIGMGGGRGRLNGSKPFRGAGAEGEEASPPVCG